MRTSKLVSALVALVLALSMVGLVATPAQAAKPKHDLTARGVGKGDSLFIKGRVTTYPNRNVVIKRKLKGERFVFYKNAPTNGIGKFKVGVDGAIGDCFKVIVPGTRKYRKTKLAGPQLCVVKVPT